VTYAPSRDHPAVLERQNLCSRLEVGVLLDNGELVRSGQGRGQQIRQADASTRQRRSPPVRPTNEPRTWGIT
jgi:hypothetical protein